jgi:hypothetical protein
MSANPLKTMPRLLSLAAICLAVAACADHSTNGDKALERVRRFRTGITFSDSQRNMEAGLTSTHFQLSAMRDLYVRVEVADTPSPTMLELVFINPIGERFYENRSLFSLDPTLKVMDDPLLGPQSRVLPMKPLWGGWALDREIAIAGTIFTRVPTADGDWNVQATVTGSPGTLHANLHLSWAN